MRNLKEKWSLDSYEHKRLNHPLYVPWIMKQTWLDTLFIHYPVKKEKLSKLVPPVLPIDTYDNYGWVSIVPYLTTSVRVRGMPPIPGMNQFAGFNVRTYVNLNGKPGIYFFRLAASNWLNVKMAKVFFKLPYICLDMNFDKKGNDIYFESESITKNDEEIKWIYRPKTEKRLAVKGSLEEWLVERYCLYTVNKNGEPFRSDIIHRSWLLQDVDVEFQHNSILTALNIVPESKEAIFQYAKKVKVKIWPIMPCENNDFFS